MDEHYVCKILSERFDTWGNLSGEAPAMDVYTAASLGCYDVIARAVHCRSRSVMLLRNKSGWTPLMYACQQQHTDIVKLLVQSGADVNYSGQDGLTPLMVASKGCDTSVVQLLLQQHISIEATDDRGWTALFHAVNMGQEDPVKLLLYSGANVNAIEASTGYSVLMVAAKGARITLVKTLLRAGAICNQISLEGETALTIAEKFGNDGVAKLLYTTNYSGCAALDEHRPKDLFTLLQSLDLERYWPLFRDQAIDLQIFLTLSEPRLTELGINLFGPRRKMSLAIARWRDPLL